MSPEKNKMGKEEGFDFGKSFDSLSQTLSKELKRSKTKTITIASFEHGNLNFHGNERWSSWHETIQTKVPIKPGEPGFVLESYALIKNAEYFSKKIKLVARLGIDLEASNILAKQRETYQRELIGKMEEALANAKKFPTSQE